MIANIDSSWLWKGISLATVNNWWPLTIVWHKWVNIRCSLFSFSCRLLPWFPPNAIWKLIPEIKYHVDGENFRAIVIGCSLGHERSARTLGNSFPSSRNENGLYTYCRAKWEGGEILPDGCLLQPVGFRVPEAARIDAQRVKQHGKSPMLLRLCWWSIEWATDGWMDGWLKHATQSIQSSLESFVQISGWYTKRGEIWAMCTLHICVSYRAINDCWSNSWFIFQKECNCILE